MDSDKPLILVDIDDSGKCSLNAEALDLIRNIQEQVCVISVAGLYRTGKSYLLNRLMGTQHGFEIGPSVNPCTKGIWIWGKCPFVSSNKRLILIDTEGLRSYQREETIDMTIFSLSLLLSSTFIYNSMGAIDEQAIEDLSLVCKLTQYIHVKSQSGQTTAESYAQYFPKFIWALRDFSLQLVDNEGNSITSNEYLENCLELLPGQTDEIKQKNEIRKILTSFFKERECFTFIRPVNNEKKLRNIQEVPYEELREEFKTQMSEFIARVQETTRVKMIDGVAVNGKLLASMLEIYVDAINQNAVPTISTAWERTLDNQIKEGYKRAYENYKNCIKSKLKSQIPMEEVKLKEIEGEIRKSSFGIIDAVPIIVSLKEEVNKQKKKLEEKFNSMLETLLDENFSESKIQATAHLKTLFDELEEKMANSEKFNWLPEEFSNIYENAIQDIPGSGAIHAIAEAYSKEGSRIVQKLISQLNRIHRSEIKEARNELDEERKRTKILSDNYENQKKDLMERLDLERKHSREQKKVLENALEDARIAISGNSQEFGQIQSKLREENMDLRNEINALKNKIVDKRHGVKEANAAEIQTLREILNEFEQMKQQKIQLEQQLDYEMKITQTEKSAQKQLLEAKRMSDQALMKLKKSYELELQSLKDDKIALEMKLKDLARELTQRDMQIKLIKEKMRGRENDQKLRLEHSDLLISVSDLILKFLQRLETGKGGDLREEIDLLQERASRLSAPRY
ncbi:unnamed protein product [Blepharisma stoltei]|uniref:GB1/RHD3-type G domain-containing protein n=1 Tax=Blepharisma stoltei TaxID=1481888 RepID=A0AAU9JB32_9CILI|nr:unnamed protein product [Blepharisma stoltei]